MPNEATLSAQDVCARLAALIDWAEACDDTLLAAKLAEAHACLDVASSPCAED